MNSDIQEQPEATPAKPMTADDAIKTLRLTAAALRKHPVIKAAYDPEDPRPPKEVDRKTWMTAANNLLDSGFLTKEQRKIVQDLKRGLVLSIKKK